MHKQLTRNMALATVLLGNLLLPGCSVFSDFKAPKYTCGLPNGTGCKPVSEVYKLSVAGRLKAAHTAGAGSTTAVSHAGGKPVATVMPGEPILTRPRHIRLWLGRWEDKDGDLHDETYLFLRLDNGQWLLQ